MLAPPEGSANVSRSSVALVGAIVTAFAMVVQATPSVHLAFLDGRVWLTASGATPSQILAEWARVGGTRIVNADRLPGVPLTIELSDAAEMDALEIVLRNTGGFIAAARTPGDTPAAPQLSRVEQIMVLPAGARPIPAPPATPVPSAAPPPPQIPIFAPSGGERVIGPDGQPVPDDQDGAPAPEDPSGR